jgi:hypothetical protein
MIQTVGFVLGAFPARSAGNRAIRGSAIAPVATLCAAPAPRPSYPLRGSVFGTFILEIVHIFKVDGILVFPVRDAQGIEAVSFFAAGKKDTSGKPGPRAVLPEGQVGARMRPETRAG